MNIEDISITRDIFYYNFKYKTTLFGNLKILELSVKEQFELYLDFINLKKLNNKKDLIASTQQLLKQMNDNKLKYSFSFYLNVFSECINLNDIDCIKNHLIIFEPKTLIEEKEEISNEIIEKIYEKLKNPEKILNLLKNEKKEELGIKLYSIILSFIYKYKKEIIDEFLNIKDDNIKKYISKAFLEYNFLFKNIKLDYTIISDLITFSENYGELNYFLKYCKNYTDIIKVICNTVKFSNLFINHLLDKKDKIIINIEEIGGKPQIDDNLKEIYEQYYNFISKLGVINKDFYKTIVFKFNFEEYINLFIKELYKEGLEKSEIKDKIIDNLFYIKKIIDFNKINQDYISDYIDINAIINEMGNYFTSKNILNNNQILNFINFYNDANKKIPREIINCLNIKNLNESFLSEWNKITFCKDYILELFQNLIDLIKDLNDFNVVFKLFNLNDKKILILFQTKFINLIEKYNPENCITFFDDLIVLLSYSIFYDLDCMKFIQNMLSLPNLKKDIKNFLSSLKEKTNPENKINVLMDYKKISKVLLFIINNYVILIKKQRQKIKKDNETNKQKLNEELTQLINELDKEKKKIGNLKTKLH